MTSRQPAVRSFVLALLVVCSAVAVTGPLAGTGAAVQTAGNTAVLTDGPNWYGQEFAVDVTGGTGGFTAQPGDTVYLLGVDDETDTVDRTAKVLTVNSSGYVVFETDDIETDNRQSYALNDDNELNSGAVNFTLEPQTLDLEWEADTVASDSESVALETVESNRGAGDYNVTVSADGFEYEQLRALFVHPGSDLEEVTDRDHLPLDRLGYDRDDGDGVAEMRSDGYITLNLAESTNYTDDGEIVANFSNLAAEETVPAEGDYEFDIVVTDSTATDRAAVRIGGVAAEFESPLYTRAAGDVASFTVDLESTDRTWVQFRDTQSGFVDVLYLQDDNDDGEVTVYANTRLVGTDHSELSGLTTADSEVVYYSDNDTVQSYIHDEVIPPGGTDVGDARFYDAPAVNSSEEITFTEYVQRVNGNAPADQLARPIQPTTYELVADRRGEFTITDGEATVADQLGETELDLVQPSARSFDTWVAPEGAADSQQTVDGLENNLTSRQTAAIGDRMVLRFNTSGVGGALAAIDYAQNGNSIDTGLSEGYDIDVLYTLAVDEDGTDWEGEGVNLTLFGEEPLNGPPETLSLDEGDSEDAYVLLDQQTAEGDQGTLYTVFDTGATAYDDSISDRQAYDVEWTYLTGAGRFRFSGPGPQGGTGGDVTDPTFPYQNAENVTVGETISFASRELTFDSVDDGTVTLEPTTDARVAGETNLAPGTPLTVTVRLAPPSDTIPDEDPSFLARQETTVDADGTFDTTFDLGNRTVGEAATVRVEREQTTIATSDAEFRDIDAVRGAYFETELDAPATAGRNETVNVTGVVTNTGQTGGTADVQLAVDGRVTVRGIFDLEAGESRRLNHSVQMGQSDIAVSVASQDTSQRTTVEYAGDTAPEQTATPAQNLTPPSQPQQAADGPQPTPSGAGGGFPWLLGGGAAAVLLTAVSLLVVRWL